MVGISAMESELLYENQERMPARTGRLFGGYWGSGIM